MPNAMVLVAQIAAPVPRRIVPFPPAPVRSARINFSADQPLVSINTPSSVRLPIRTDREKVSIRLGLAISSTTSRAISSAGMAQRGRIVYSSDSTNCRTIATRIAIPAGQRDSGSPTDIHARFGRAAARPANSAPERTPSLHVCCTHSSGV